MAPETFLRTWGEPYRTGFTYSRTYPAMDILARIKQLYKHLAVQLTNRRLRMSRSVFERLSKQSGSSEQSTISNSRKKTTGKHR
jgi:hypothetical protein